MFILESGRVEVDSWKSWILRDRVTGSNGSNRDQSGSQMPLGRDHFG